MAILAGTVATAQAAPSCIGRYSAASLQPLPQPAIVHFELMNNSPRNIQLAQALNNGLVQGGLPVAGAPTTDLTLSYHILNQGGSGGYDQWGAQSNWGGMDGGVSLEQPDMPRFGAAPAPGPATLILRADLRDALTNAPLWIATLQCQLQTSPDSQLAYDLGVMIGRSAGKPVNQAPF